jgi:peptidoglycan/LPS O-acetylase OafA/YrhL
MSGTTNQSGTSKLLGLEIIRFACALAVLVCHYHHFALIGDGRLMDGPHAPLEWLLFPFYQFGSFGVQIFWCISGFIFFRQYSVVLTERTIDAKRFFWLRFSRLYPLHFVTLLVVAAMQPIYGALAGHPFVYDNNGPFQFLLHLFLADQWGGSFQYSFNGPVWSVSAEIIVYLAFFLLMRTFGKSPWVVLGAIAAGLTSLWSGAISPALICGAYFFAGGAASEALLDLPRRKAWQIGAIALIGTAILAAPFLDLGDSDTDRLATWLLAVTPPLLFLAAQDWRWLDRWQSPIQAGGNLTYSTYLIQFPLQLIIVTGLLALGIAPPVDKPWFLFAYLAATIILGRVVFLRFEAPAQRMIRAAMLARTAETAAA